MNALSARLLQDSEENFGNTLFRQRQLESETAARQQQLELERQSRDITEKRLEAAEAMYGARGAHEGRMEDIATQTARGKAQQEGDMNQKNMDAIDLQTKSGILKQALQLNQTGQMTDASRDAFNKWLQSDAHFGPTGIQIQKYDPSIAAKGPKGGAVQAMMLYRNQERDAADNADNPDEQAQHQKAAADADAWITHQTQFAPQKTPRDYTDITSDSAPDAAGNTRKTTARTYSPLPGTPPAGPVAPAAPLAPPLTPSPTPAPAGLPPLGGVGVGQATPAPKSWTWTPTGLVPTQ